MTNKSYKPYIPSPDLKPGKIVPFTKRKDGQSLWNEKDKTIDVGVYVTSMQAMIADVDYKLAQEEKLKKEIAWYQDYKDQMRAEMHLDDDNRIFQRSPHNRKTINYN